MTTTIEVTQMEYKIAKTLYNTGFTNKEIGKLLNLSDRTIESHILNLYLKLNVKTDRQFFVWMKNNCIKPINISSKRKKEKIMRTLELKNEGLNAKQISKRLDISETSVYEYLKQKTSVICD